MITSSAVFGQDCTPAEYPSIDPIRLAGMWIPAPGSAPPPLMALATVGADGFPRVRHVLLSEFADGAVYFHTDTGSAKVAELRDHPQAAVAVAWPEVGRQLLVRGTVTRATAAEERAVYARRGRYLQLLAWLNTPEQAALPVAARHAAWTEFDAAHADLEPPGSWAGFALRPEEFTFWRGDPDGPSQRVRYRRAETAWTVEVLPG
ncbi:pyridoxine/pyridoxamine 5'-phosphate oxidase [Nocardia sp. alder85J]|uniref:pyridoxine/pyridoxamine 5'-phosphate oxidase n=1 Tax=Nocardia sp. alder85J TaxID=2862949 RepID=UPI001CD2FF7F|nr:pyridoxamine 5'-phosphate oxidase family protein [Nocardia sp. alder85J]MCX4095168.1 pyridoxamine 5'-phosphate oxidase family protein [Nocardia sp. alder85J]